MGSAIEKKRVELEDGDLVLYRSLPGSTGMAVAGKPKVRLYRDRVRVECMDMSREAFQFIAKKWAEYLDEDGGREL